MTVVSQIHYELEHTNFARYSEPLNKLAVGLKKEPLTEILNTLQSADVWESPNCKQTFLDGLNKNIATIKNIESLIGKAFTLVRYMDDWKAIYEEVSQLEMRQRDAEMGINYKEKVDDGNGGFIYENKTDEESLRIYNDCTNLIASKRSEMEQLENIIKNIVEEVENIRYGTLSY